MDNSNATGGMSALPNNAVNNSNNATSEQDWRSTTVQDSDGKLHKITLDANALEITLLKLVSLF